MSDAPLTAEDVRAAAEVQGELGADYGDAVVESFLAKVDKQIEARVDERIARLTGQSRLTRRKRPADPVRLGKLRIALGAAPTGCGAASRMSAAIHRRPGHRRTA
jgi:hypothetical protein